MERLIKETSWSRVYERQDGSRINRSKFRADGLSITFEEVKRSWPQWNERERLDFAQAFSAKTEFAADDDCRILEFIMKEGSEIAASSLADALASCSRSQSAFDLIVSRLQSASIMKFGFFQALARLRNERAVPILEEFRERLVAEIANAPKATDLAIDYLSCCAALAVLTRNLSYKRAVEAYLNDERETVREWAATMIRLKLADL